MDWVERRADTAAEVTFCFNCQDNRDLSTWKEDTERMEERLMEMGEVLMLMGAEYFHTYRMRLHRRV